MGGISGILRIPNVYKGTHSSIEAWNSIVKRTEVGTVKESMVKMICVEKD